MADPLSNAPATPTEGGSEHLHMLAQLKGAEDCLRRGGYDQVARGLRLYLADVDAGDSTASLDRCLGLRRHGGVSAARSVVLARRDRLIVQLWKTSPEWCDLPPVAVARLMKLTADRYAQSRWREERNDITAPPAEPQATWWRILQMDVPIPDVRRLKQVLSDGAF